MIVQRLTEGVAAALLADAKHHFRVDHADDDAEITCFIGAAQSEIEEYGLLAVTRQTIRITSTGWPAGGWGRLPIGPVESDAPYSPVTANGVEIAPELIDGARPRLDMADARKYLPCEIVAEYTAGFATPPNDLLTAMMEKAAALYEGRAVARIRGEAEGGMSAQAARIAARYRMVAV